ncbi:hypothetical protein V6N11_015001 [Hibiscus sabdariffa]|uniref:SEC7 domain-containing protein n=1 Tax=Hibiscus sabdariffa TaxID=183260 RepID=A0ABR2TR68_9ROSI
MKHIKRKLAIEADHFNRDPKKGLEFLQEINLLPDKLDPESVASFFRYTTGLDKNLIRDFLGNHDEFCVQVLHEFVKTFDFSDMNLDSALRVFLGTFRLPGEIQRVLEAFAERYYEQSPHILCNKDAALLLSYSLILLNTDQHNVQVKKKMTEEDFIRNNRLINGEKDLPRDYLSELYHCICENEIQMIPDQAEQKDVLQMCIEGFLAVAKISAHYHFGVVLDDLVVSLCKFTNLSTPLSIEEAIVFFGDDAGARMATTTVFTIANSYASDAADEIESKPATSSLQRLRTAPAAIPQKSSSLIERFSQFLSFDMEEPRLYPTEEELAARQHLREIVQEIRNATSIIYSWRVSFSKRSLYCNLSMLSTWLQVDSAREPGSWMMKAQQCFVWIC